MYFDLIATMVLYIKQKYPEDKFAISDHDLKIYSAQLWACDELISLCLQNISCNPLNIVEDFIELHEIMIGELEIDDPKRDYFSAVLTASYAIRGYLRDVSK